MVDNGNTVFGLQLQLFQPFNFSPLLGVRLGQKKPDVYQDTRRATTSLFFHALFSN